MPGLVRFDILCWIIFSIKLPPSTSTLKSKVKFLSFVAMVDP